jgi:cold shock CspA family protein
VTDEYDSERFPDNFYQGMILRLDRARGRGVVRSHSGKDILFEFPFVSVVGAGIGGAMAGIELLREGDVVGFDVGWTSKGLRVTSIQPRGNPESNRSD